MTDDEFEQRRERAILAAMQTVRPVFADSEGRMRYADGDREALADEVGVPVAPMPQATVRVRSTWWGRVKWWLGM